MYANRLVPVCFPVCFTLSYTAFGLISMWLEICSPLLVRCRSAYPDPCHHHDITLSLARLCFITKMQRVMCVIWGHTPSKWQRGHSFLMSHPLFSDLGFLLLFVLMLFSLANSKVFGNILPGWIAKRSEWNLDFCESRPKKNFSL